MTPLSSKEKPTFIFKCGWASSSFLSKQNGLALPPAAEHHDEEEEGRPCRPVLSLALAEKMNPSLSSEKRLPLHLQMR